MIVSLRKRHKAIWVLLSILLPLSFLLAYLKIPENVLEDVPQKQQSMANYQDAISISFLQMESNYRCKIEVREPLTSAFTLVYLSKNKEVEAGSSLLGSIDKMGTYNFSVPSEIYTGHPFIVLFDQLNQTIIYHQTLNASTP